MRRRQMFAEQYKQSEAKRVLSVDQAAVIKQNIKVVDMFKCTDCEKSFRSVHGLKVHNSMVHK
jgi:hypothetical protein